MPPKKPTPPRSPAITAAVVCENVKIHEAVPGQHRGEHQRVQLPPPVPVADHPQVAEIELHLLARLPVGHRHRHLLPGRGVPALRRGEPGQRPVRHRRPGPLQQLAHLHQRQAVLHPPGDLGLPPAPAPPTRRRARPGGPGAPPPPPARAAHQSAATHPRHGPGPPPAPPRYTARRSSRPRPPAWPPGACPPRPATPAGPLSPVSPEPPGTPYPAVSSSPK